MPDLQRLVQQRLDELNDGRPMTPRRAAREVAQGRVSYETLRKIIRGEHSGDLTEHVVEGLVALGINRADILRAINRGHLAELPRWTPPDAAHRMTLQQRRLVESLIYALADDRYQTGTDSDRSDFSDGSHGTDGRLPAVTTERVQLTPEISSVLGRLGEAAESSPELRDELATFSEDLFRRYGQEQTNG